MKHFIDIDNIDSDDELLSIIKSNIEKAKTIRKEIRELENVDLIEESKFECEEYAADYTSKTKDKIDEDDIEYDYYYEPIRIIPITATYDEVYNIIKDNLPSKNNTNYFRLYNRIKAEIYREIIELQEMIKQTDDIELLDDIRKSIEFERQKLDIVNDIQLDEKIEKINYKKNNIIFHTTNNGNIYALDDIDKISPEYFDSIYELITSIQNGIFKNVKILRTSNDKTSGISEVRGFKTRVIFDRIGKNEYVILQVSIKKSDFDKAYKESLETRISTYRVKRSEYITKLDNKELFDENEEILYDLFKKLLQPRKKMMLNE